MERITLKIRTTKTGGEIRLRFRLLDGRRADLTHKSGIVASLKDLEKFNTDGSLKPKVSVYNRVLRSAIEREIEVMHQAYRRMVEGHLPINGEVFERVIDSIVNPDAGEVEEETLLERFGRFIEESYENGVFSRDRRRHYETTCRILGRFLAVSGQGSVTPSGFGSDDVVKFGQFVASEYQYVTVKRWAYLYSDVKKKTDIPSAPRNQNTVATKLKMLRALFSELEAAGEIDRSPFSTSGRKRIREFLSERENVPFFLTADEFARVLAAEDIPSALRETHEAFLVHCSLGCRIGDFQRLTMANVSVSPEGIPYIHYIPRKTQRQARSNEEIQTPVMRYALDIIKRREFDFPVTRYASGKSGYNKKIKALMEHCGIDRDVPVFDEETGQNRMVPLHEVASSKLARKTFVDMMAKVQIDVYASGLHARGSDAVTHYTALRLEDRFALMNVAFRQPDYRVDRELNVL